MTGRVETDPESDVIVVPTGAPAWVTAELLVDTRNTWQRYYAEPLTVTDLLEILLDVGRLFDDLEDCDEIDEEAVCRPGPRVEP